MTTKKRLTPGLIRKGIAITFIIGLFTIVGLLFSSTTPATWRSLRMIHPKNICLMVGVVVVSWLVEGWRVKTIAYLLGEQISFLDTLRINLATIFSGNITPLYSGSVPTQVYLLHQQGISIGKASAIVTIRVTFTSLLVSIGGPFLLFLFRGKLLNEIGLVGLAGFLNYIIIGALIFAGVLLFFLFRPTKGSFLIKKFFRLKPVQKILGPSAETYCQKLLTEWEEFRASLSTLAKDKILPLLFVIFLTLCSWLSTLLMAPVVMMAFGVNIHGKIFRILLLEYVIYFLLSFVPIPGGSGVAEIGFFSLFAIYLPKHLQAISVTIWRLLSYYLNTLVGGVCFLRLFTAKHEKH
ncbi:MAG TPA: flippase-like domain-containing protein [Firmicutes bacterium]|uniref:Phosphatidylglycerol lysyltransferase n=1 Tax=Capillibacterium thermochitinicola TaxID=2699427 RepID=A0A8J6LIK9_9FIRM|nr:lysylphosphatidylglycerol synthase transmembrane domain-containing protein [Capillibacterium thermochitinicola]MBA2132766.1 flippase-like domain-containing protein [Capillibacterium thermochitinicola]HHW12513.1 flippase-like domain-containing protein [Bacillota bacterium]